MDKTRMLEEAKSALCGARKNKKDTNTLAKAALIEYQKAEEELQNAEVEHDRLYIAMRHEDVSNIVALSKQACVVHDKKFEVSRAYAVYFDLTEQAIKAAAALKELKAKIKWLEGWKLVEGEDND
ncbi:MAG: hypothetical protein LBS60_08825 [Deltaproteobacteria bacterium]|jgi:negative regulator of genetic competence, sporulation and motility|nr:hypothetical protein [Deltaproteobacteria bacterium]